MATIYIDIGAIFREVRLLITELKNERTADKKKTRAAQLLVYRALSVHPALDSMRPPTGILADVDWYTELRSTFNSGIFRKLGQNDHFKRMALLGDTGTRARIMMLLLWIVGHRLSEDGIAKLLSTVFEDAIKRDGNSDLETELAQLDSVNRVLVSLRKMIKTKLPLPPDRNPFQGRDYNAEDEDKPLPRSSLWGYELPEEQRYEYDIRRNPVLLLRPLPSKVIIPQTKLTILIIQWAACNFGLGKKVYSASDIDPEAFWNADPPPPSSSPENKDDDYLSDWSSEDSLSFEPHPGIASAPYEAMWDNESTEEFIHSRFCSVYKMHGWAHRSFVRVLLFNTFSASQALQISFQMILSAVHLTDRLLDRLPMDIWKYAEQFIIAHSLLVWHETYAANTLNLDFSALSPAERGMLIIFVDVIKWTEAWPAFFPPLVFSVIREFLFNPTRRCQDGPDILSLPLLAAKNSSDALNVLPELDANTCICGECPLICLQLPRYLEGFRHQYFTLTSSRPHNCDALARAWEPAVSAAEEWLDNLISRVECQFMLFPWTEELDRRIGPAVLELSNTFGVSIGEHLSNDLLLRFVVMLSMITDVHPPTVPKSPGMFGLGYVVSMPWAADREDYHVTEGSDGGDFDRVLFVNGGWMYDSVSLDGISILHEHEGFTIVSHMKMRPQFSAICMPNFRADTLSLFPARHSVAGNPSQASLQQEEEQNEEEMKLTFVLSNWQSDAFPLLSVSPSVFKTGFFAPAGALATLIRVDYLGRTIETCWKPDVKQGSSCEHTSLWGRSTRCSPAAKDLFRLVLPPHPHPHRNHSDSSVFTPEEEPSAAVREFTFSVSKDVNFRRQKVLREMMDEHARRLVSLMEVGSPLERNRACVVRCGAKDGPVDAVVVLATSLKKKVYVLNYRECWECAFAHMQEQGRSIGIAIDTKQVTVCDECQPT